MQEKLFESEAKVMEIIWTKSPISAKEISLIAAETIGWNKNTTYTAVSYTHLDVYKRQPVAAFEYLKDIVILVATA